MELFTCDGKKTNSDVQRADINKNFNAIINHFPPVKSSERALLKNAQIQKRKAMLSGMAFKSGGVDGTRTRGLRRDRPAL